MLATIGAALAVVMVWSAGIADARAVTVHARTGGAVRGRAEEHALLQRLRHSGEGGIALARSATEPRWACPESTCEAIVDPPAASVRRQGRARFALPAGGPLLEGGGEEGGLDPQDLQAAYNIPLAGGEGRTIAVIGSYAYKAAEKDLAKYRERYGLPPCTKKNHCFAHVNQSGGKPKGKKNKEWNVENALDLDMASAACPHCHLLLVNAETGSWKQLGEAVDRAAAMGATVISNSYGISEELCSEECEATRTDFEHPGVMIFASAGDRGYDNFQEGLEAANWPATLPSVISVGGTALHKSPEPRGWSEEAWLEPSRGLGSGGGCAWFYSGEKPVWQTDAGCGYHTDNDVAAVGACATPVSIYDSGEGGWLLVCGTSASSPLVAGIEAQASAYARSLPGADAFYQDPAASFDVTAGTDGTCTPPSEHAYLCTAGPGYDGPTGNGTPNGPLQVTAAPPVVITGGPGTVAGGTATLSGRIGPQGLATSYRFEYGTSTAYGEDAPAPDGSAGSGTAVQPVSQPLSGLAPNTVYHYRLVATNAQGTAYGADASFSTAPPVVESVSPTSGPTEGGTEVTITGANFIDVSEVSFGGESASFTVNSDTSITATAAGGKGSVPVTVTTPAGTSEAGPGAGFEYVLGPVVAWGMDEGALGQGFYTRDRSAPVEVRELPPAKSLAAGGGWAAGGAFSAAVLANGDAMAWGFGYNGQLGNGTSGNGAGSASPVHVCAVLVSSCPNGPYLEDAVQVAAGAKYVLALLEDGTVVAWGSGALGSSSKLPRIATPTPVCMVAEYPCNPANYMRNAVAVAAGHEVSYALLSDGTVWAWGSGKDGELGNGTTEYWSGAPVQVSGITEGAVLGAGGYGGMVILKNGTLETWGWNEFGNLGDGTTETSLVPVHVCAGPAGKNACATDLSGVKAVAGRNCSEYALLQDGTVRSWGCNRWGQLGTGDETFAGGQTEGPEICHTGDVHANQPCSRVPLQVVGLNEVTRIASAGTGQYVDTMAVRANGDVMTWGEDLSGDLGDHTPYGDTTTPVHVCAVYATAPCPSGPWLNGEVTAIAAGGEHDLVSFAAPVPAPDVTAKTRAARTTRRSRLRGSKAPRAETKTRPLTEEAPRP
jgi:alpha-tubulin suppressor-like RCC1 family protein